MARCAISAFSCKRFGTIQNGNGFLFKGEQKSVPKGHSRSGKWKGLKPADNPLAVEHFDPYPFCFPSKLPPKGPLKGPRHRISSSQISELPIDKPQVLRRPETAPSERQRLVSKGSPNNGRVCLKIGIILFSFPLPSESGTKQKEIRNRSTQGWPTFLFKRGHLTGGLHGNVGSGGQPVQPQGKYGTPP